MGMLNAAVWLGATVFCSTAILAALNSQAMVNLVGVKYFSQLSGAMTQIIFARLFHLQIACALLAWLHLLGEWLYLGRPPRRWLVALLTALFALSLMGSLWLGPKLRLLHRTQHALNTRLEGQELAERTFRRWNGVFQALNVVMIGGVLVYFWRVTKSDDSPRFVRPVNFRS
jgi:hypothetical protein